MPSTRIDAAFVYTLFVSRSALAGPIGYGVVLTDRDLIPIRGSCIVTHALTYKASMPGDTSLLLRYGNLVDALSRLTFGMDPTVLNLTINKSLFVVENLTHTKLFAAIAKAAPKITTYFFTDRPGVPYTNDGVVVDITNKSIRSATQSYPTSCMCYDSLVYRAINLSRITSLFLLKDNSNVMPSKHICKACRHGAVFSKYKIN